MILRIFIYVVSTIEYYLTFQILSYPLMITFPYHSTLLTSAVGIFAFNTDQLIVIITVIACSMNIDFSQYSDYATGWKTGVRLLVGAGIYFSSTLHLDRLWGPPRLRELYHRG